jgi:hypothetical protein
MDQSTLMIGAILAMFVVWLIVNNRAAYYLSLIGL